MAISSILRQILCSFSTNFASKLRFCKKKIQKGGGGMGGLSYKCFPLVVHFDNRGCQTISISSTSNKRAF